MKKISIVLVDDHQLFLEGMERILESENEFSVINNFQSSEKLMVTNFVSPPDLFVLDVEIPVINGIALCQYIKEKYPSSKVLFVSMYVNNQFVRAAKEADADGFISKNSSAQYVKQSIRSILCDNKIFPALINKTTSNNGLLMLSKREKEIMQLIKAGKTSKKIAEELFISEFTVETHRKNIFKKLKIESSVQLVNFMHEHHM